MFSLVMFVSFISTIREEVWFDDAAIDIVDGEVVARQQSLIQTDPSCLITGTDTRQVTNILVIMTSLVYNVHKHVELSMTRVVMM